MYEIDEIIEEPIHIYSNTKLINPTNVYEINILCLVWVIISFIIMFVIILLYTTIHNSLILSIVSIIFLAVFIYYNYINIYLYTISDKI